MNLNEHVCKKTDEKQAIIRGVAPWVWSKYRIETVSKLPIWADIDQYRIDIHFGHYRPPLLGYSLNYVK